MVIAAGSLQAETVKRSEQVSHQKFISHVKNYLMHLNGESKPVFNGELADLGGECSVTIEKDKNNKDMIVLRSDKNLKLEVVVRENDQIKLYAVSSDDGSFVDRYSFGTGGVKKFVVTYEEDAGMSVALQYGSTSLNCQVGF